MKKPLAALALLLVLPLAACSGGDPEPGSPESSSGSGSSAAPSEDAELPVPTEQICAGLDVGAVGEALGGSDLEVDVDAVAGENGAGGFPILAPQCTLRGDDVTLDLSIAAADAGRDLTEDLAESLEAAEQQGFQTCEDLRTIDSFEDREAVGYDCDIAGAEVEASSIAVRMAPDWLLSCAVTAPRLEQTQIDEGLPAACAVVVESLAS